MPDLDALDRKILSHLQSDGRITMQELADKAPVIVETWMLGVEAGNAVADVVFGKYSPAGRLPAAFPRVSASVPFYYAGNPTGRPADPDLAKDTVRYHDLPITPLFPFGHGLSYTTFTYSNLAVSPSGEATFVVRNGGVASIATLTQFPFPKAKISQLGTEVATVEKGLDQQDRPGDHRQSPEHPGHRHAPAPACHGDGDHAERGEQEFCRQQRHRGRLSDRRVGDRLASRWRSRFRLFPRVRLGERSATSLPVR